MAALFPSDKTAKALRACHKIVLSGTDRDLYKITFWNDRYQVFSIELKEPLNGGEMGQSSKKSYDQTVLSGDPLIRAVDRPTAYRLLRACYTNEPTKYDRSPDTILWVLSLLKS